jgi:hypothetical protein
MNRSRDRKEYLSIESQSNYMNEDVGTLIGKGFNTWKRNLNLAVPFALNVIILGLLALIVVLLVFLPIISTFPGGLDSLLEMQDVEEVLNAATGVIEGNIGIIVSAVLIFVVLAALISAFFTAGAIGMAREATDRGTTTLKEMWWSGKRHYLGLLAAQILMAIIVLIVSAILMALLYFFITENPESIAMMMFSAFLAIVYLFLIALVLSMVPYALVIDDLGPISAIKAGIKFVLTNKMDVFLIWLVVLSISMAFGLLGALFARSELMGGIWSVLNVIINIVVLAPLSTLWWARLYMSRTGKEIGREEFVKEEVQYL